MPGTLYVVATPIGNLDDISPRAIETLRSVAWIACEDTRHTRKLLARHGIATRTVSCHRHNERERVDRVLGSLRGGESVALVSDGGTPGIADPGALLARSAALEGFTLVPIPGPCAAVAFLSVSGLAADRFVFDGFLPSRSGERRRRLRELSRESRSVVLFEAPHRIRTTLRDCAEILGERPIVLGRELTKRHETILRGSARDLIRSLGDGEVRGEIVLAFSGATELPAAPRTETTSEALEVWRAALRDAGGDSRLALRQAARALSMKRSALYRLLAELREIEDTGD